MYTLKVKSHFDAAHFLPWHEGKCKNLHGHRWEVEVEIGAKELDENGIVIDFGDIEKLLPDHQFLNEGEYILQLGDRFPEYKDVFNDVARKAGNWLPNPTAEKIAAKLWMSIKKMLSGKGVQKSHVYLELWESPDCSTIYGDGK